MFRTLLAALVGLVVATSTLTPALAHDGWWDDRGGPGWYREHHHRPPPPPGWGYYRPVPPPPVYYYAPPQPIYPAPSVNFVFPIR